MTADPLLLVARSRLTAALGIFFASVDAYVTFVPGRAYSAKELEPYDALSDRFLRAFESCIKFFRTVERFRELAPSESFRDLLHRMEKYGLISSAEVWLQLRDTRNRIAHEYLPEELAKIYRDIVGAGAAELREVTSRLDGIVSGMS